MAQAVNVNFRMDAELKKNADPFYSENNMAHLRRGIAALDSGKGVEHELLLEDGE